MAYEWVINALDDTWGSIDRFMRSQPREAYRAPTSCPGWDVQDVISHLLGFESMLRGAPVPTHEGSWPQYVHNPIGEVNEAFVAFYRSWTGPEVLDAFREISQRSLEALRQLSDAEWEKVGWSPEGERPYHRFQETRVLDSWIHLQDIRDALLQPEDDHGAGEEIVINRFESALPYIVGRKMKCSDGTTVHVNLSGRLARTVRLEMREGRAEHLASNSSPATLEITTPVALFWRRAAGRISAQAFLGASATDVRGDRDLARSFSDALHIMI